MAMLYTQTMNDNILATLRKFPSFRSHRFNPNDGTIWLLHVKANDCVGTGEEKAIVAAYANTL